MSAPWWLLVVGVALAVGAVAVGLLIDSTAARSVAWLLGGPVVIGLFGAFVMLDGRRQAHPWYRRSPVADVGRRFLVLAALVAVTVNAWGIADHLARSGGGS